MSDVFYRSELSNPTNIAKFQRVFEDACRTRNTEPDSTEARAIALNIVALYKAGWADEAMLRRAVSQPRREDRID